MKAAAAILCILAIAGCATPANTPAGSGGELACVDHCAVEVALAGGYAWEPHVAVDPTDPTHLIAGVTRFTEGPASALANDILVAVTRDGGRTWTSSAIPHGAAAPPGHPLATADDLGDPIVAFLPDGTALLAGLAMNSPTPNVVPAAQGFRVFVARSSDGGDTFPEISIVAEDAGLAVITPLGVKGAALHGPDAPNIAIGRDGTILLVWRWLDLATPADPPRTGLAYATSSNGGRTWSEHRRIDTGTMNAVPQPAIIADDGAFLVAFEAWQGDESDPDTKFGAWFARSEDQGATWETQLVGERSWTAQLAKAADGIFVGYAEEDDEGRETVRVRASRDGGITFDAPVDLSTPEAPGDAFPTLAGDGRRAYATYFHATGSTYELRAIAFGKGPLSTPITIATGITTPPGELGEYFGLAALPDGAYAVWAENEAEGRAVGAKLVWRDT